MIENVLDPCVPLLYSMHQWNNGGGGGGGGQGKQGLLLNFFHK